MPVPPALRVGDGHLHERKVPPALELHDVSGSREVLCWLQDGAHEVPPELNQVPPTAGTAGCASRACADGDQDRVTPTARAPLLEAVDVTKHYQVRVGRFGRSIVHAAENISVALRPGTVTAVVGESGSGKSTLSRLLARTQSLTSGKLLFEGEEVDLSQGGPPTTGVPCSWCCRTRSRRSTRCTTCATSSAGR